jgi:glycogen(starch) synthase
MRVLMLGWEFPPFISGGLGTACYGLTRAMSRLGTEIIFVLPEALGNEGAVDSVSESAGRAGIAHLPLYSPYSSRKAGRPIFRQAAGQPAQLRWTDSINVIGAGTDSGYEGDLLEKVWEYAQRCTRLAQDENFDVIHAHDWITFPAGIAVAQQSGKPLVVQVHSTEFDRSGEDINQAVYETEYRGVHSAAVIIAVSNYTREILVKHYGVSEEKVKVIHNGIEPRNSGIKKQPRPYNEKIVLFLGRITRQKGPEFFVRAAALVLEKLPDTRFIIAGWGDSAAQTIEQVAAIGLGRKILFTGFLHGQAVECAYKMADVYVMPSVSEPFGLTALEAIQHGVPVILSRSSGVAELLYDGAIKVDFWDTEKIANKIIALLNNPQLTRRLSRTGLAEIRPLTWDQAARKCLSVYQQLLAI